MDALAAADNLAVTLRRDEIDTQGDIGAIRGQSEIECLYRGRVAIDHHRAVEIVSDQGLVGVAQIAPPLDLAALGFEFLDSLVVCHAMEGSLDRFELGD